MATMIAEIFNKTLDDIEIQAYEGSVILVSSISAESQSEAETMSSNAENTETIIAESGYTVSSSSSGVYYDGSEY